MTNVEWLLRKGPKADRLRMGERTVIDNESWRATIERLHIGPGLRVFLTDAQLHENLAVEARDDRTDQWLGSQLTIAGRADIDFADGTRASSSPDQGLLFRPGGRHAAYGLKAGSRFQSVGFGLEIGRIARLFDGEVPGTLRDLVDRRDEAQSRVVTHASTRTMRAAASALFARGLNGPLRALMMEGAVIQLLALQAAATEEAPRRRQPRALGARQRDAVHEARRLLLADMRSPPSLGDLAARVGLSEKQLNAGFRQVFGATVFEVLRDERLAHARIALQSEGALLKEIAFRVGYNHVTNFINAFSRRYGASPRRYLSAAPGEGS
jgi:AraC-like DNA-binding protein